MFSQLFSKYLVDQGVINQDERENILQNIATTRAKMGTIAVAEKMLTEEQAEELNQLQLQVDKRFGDLAIEKGYLKQEDVEKLLRKQGSPYILFVQLAEEKAKIALSVIEEKMAEFQKMMGFSEQELQYFKDDDIDHLISVIAPSSNPNVTILASLALRYLVRFATADFYVERIHKSKELPYEKLAGQFMSGEYKIFVGYATKGKSCGLTTIANAFAKEQYADDSDDVFDAIGEFTNCMNGLFATNLSGHEIDVDMEPPVAYENGIITGQFYVLPIYVKDELVELVISVDTEIEMGSDELKLNIEKNVTCKEKKDGQKSVLIVDDSKMSRKVLRDVLEGLGYHIVGEAVDGIEGVEEYKRLKPDIVTLDVTMPNMDGIEALDKIMQFDSHAQAVMITAAGQQKRIIEAIKLGAKKFITKPFDKDDIVHNFGTL